MALDPVSVAGIDAGGVLRRCLLGQPVPLRARQALLRAPAKERDGARYNARPSANRLAPSLPRDAQTDDWADRTAEVDH
jgi:hypothetical protein